MAQQQQQQQQKCSITGQRNTLQTPLCHNQNVSPYADLSMSDMLSVNTSN